ncbi:S41 family peptidase [Runella sp. MFBS21]|uniref:S41 family peptidase n=1 Tax=Runella sp. MFBS21 TaxID=3034018 RepID=UPI0023F7A380|nr:S41 family peptidase [Runella sp. MFBS21]MDF7819798.1 S41 family peptidase [Runella sp. MFBS21]
MSNIAKFTVGSLIAFALMVVSCKQNDPAPQNTTPTTTTTTTTTSADIRDSLWAYMQDVYLWYDKLPSNFNPRSYATPESEMDALRAYQPLDQWSFVEKASSFNSYFSDGETSDFGFWIKYDANNDLRVRYVYAQSPAGKAGIERGWKLTTVNGQSVKSLSDDALISAFYEATSTTFGFQKPDGSTVTTPLTTATYTLNTVLYNKVYEVAGKKVGYFVFNSFTGTPSQNELKTVLSTFEAAGVNEMIVDLRYNGGGDVDTQTMLANALAPSSVSRSSVMFSYLHNTKLSAWNETIRFSKTGSLNLSRIFFITSAASASASELLINNLKPYLDVKTIGKTTHGKPVGMYGFEVMDYVIAPIAFKTVNAKNVGDYYSGIAVDADVADGLDKNWGDPLESCLASALAYIQTGSFATTTQARLSAETEASNRPLDQKSVRDLVVKAPAIK